MKAIKVGLIGYGLSGRNFHGAIIRNMPEYEVIKVVTTDDVKKEQVLADFPDAKVIGNVEMLFSDEQVELVIVCTNNISHVTLAEKAMRSGKHVVIEKPFTVTTSEANHLIAVSKETGVKLSIYHNRRFDSDFKTVKKLLESEALGEIVEFESHFDRFRNTLKVNSWREDHLPGSGTLYDLGSHLIDQALNLFGLPDEIYADIRSQRQGKVDDQFELILYYPVLKVTLKAGNLVKAALPRFIVLGKQGAFVKYGFDVQEEALRSGKLPKDEHWGEEPESLWGVLNLVEEKTVIKSEPGDYRAYYMNIYDAIRNDAPLAVTAIEGKNVISVIENAILSNREKRRVRLK